MFAGKQSQSHMNSSTKSARWLTNKSTASITLVQNIQSQKNSAFTTRMIGFAKIKSNLHGSLVVVSLSMDTKYVETIFTDLLLRNVSKLVMKLFAQMLSVDIGMQLNINSKTYVICCSE